MTEQAERSQRSMADIASDLGENAMELYERLDLARQVQEHPYRTLAIAAGIGYVLGGGLFTPLTGLLVRIGTRAMMLPLLHGALGGVGTAQDESQAYF